MTPDDIGSNLADPVWRLSNLYWIVDKGGNRIKFEPNWMQRQFIANCSQSDIILKARQLGCTTLMCLIGLDEATFLNDWRVAIIAHTISDAIEIFANRVKDPYDHLPAAIKALKRAKNDRANLLRFEHGSSIRVATSVRSDTLQRLHVSEFGKICARYPQKAREIVTGGFPAVGKNPKTIESTAEGQEGHFFRYCQDAMRGDGEFRFHFYPWWRDPENMLLHTDREMTKEQSAYFDNLESGHDIILTPEQKAWYVAQEYALGGDMKRENPSTPEEAFEAAIEGAYFSAQFMHADKHGLIGDHPFMPGIPVNTFWDLGRNDMTTIWLHQRVGSRDRFISYYENSGEHVTHYLTWLREFKNKMECEWGDHHWPHDGDRDDLFLEHGRLAEVDRHGFRPKVVPRVKNKLEAIEAARTVFANCDFNATDCDIGLKRLRHYRKDWDDIREVWKDRPRHDENSHAADGFMTFATGYSPPSKVHRKKRRATGWGA